MLWADSFRVPTGGLNKRKVTSLSHVQLFAAPWTVAYQVPLSMGFSRQEYWSGVLFSSPEDLPDPGIKPASHALAGRFFATEPPGKPYLKCIIQWFKKYSLACETITTVLEVL